MNIILGFLIHLSSLASRAFSELHYVYRRLTGRSAKPELYRSILENVRQLGPEAFNGVIRSSFSYEPDTIDFSKHPLVFLYDKQGDCDDFAHLCSRLLEDMGYQTYLISVFSELDKGHAVCVATGPDGLTYGFGNWQLMRFKSDDFIEVGIEICRIGYDCKPKFIIKFDNRWNFKEIHFE